ncbi:hypothetical protein VMCG_04756 [Cytospora schulzeri]|uniref:Uncharacterized protein n=1 Tax=Cytospora schulzeri TaxID=448051 RepID=A0A423WMM4_9PEZI|nr:hypothetical protein VMCG_04756 [Valsa malicola]
MDHLLDPPVGDNCDLPRQSVEHQDTPIEIPKKKRNRTTRGKKKYIAGKGPRARIDPVQPPDDPQDTSDMSDVEDAAINMSQVPNSPVWGRYSDRRTASPSYILNEGLLNQKDMEIPRAAIAFMHAQASDLRHERSNTDTRLDKREAQHVLEMEQVRNEHKQLFKDQRDDFDSVRKEDTARWNALLREQRAQREDFDSVRKEEAARLELLLKEQQAQREHWGAIVVLLILCFIVWALN